jgi:hypothetical protein
MTSRHCAGPQSFGPNAGASSQIWIDEFSSCGDEFNTEFGCDLEEELDLHVPPACVKRCVTARLRIPYRTGVDAKKTALYRSYDVDSSPVLRYLTKTRRVDMTFIMRLINAVIENAPEHNRPLKPTRDEKRSRPALVFWLDRHSDLVFQFLWSHPWFG